MQYIWFSIPKKFQISRKNRVYDQILKKSTQFVFFSGFLPMPPMSEPDKSDKRKDYIYRR